jgi:hypothetical protein
MTNRVTPLDDNNNITSKRFGENNEVFRNYERLERNTSRIH